MAGQRGFFDADERLNWLSAAGDPLERLTGVVDFELFRADLERALNRPERVRGGRPPYDPVPMFKVLVLQTLYTPSGDQYCFARPAGLFFGDAKDDNQQPGLASAVNAAAMATSEAGNEHDRYRDLGAPGAGRCQRISQF